MPRILVAECKQESSSFNPVRSHYEDFSIAMGGDVMRRHHGVGSEMAGALHIFADRADIEIVPTYSARSITSAYFTSGSTCSMRCAAKTSAIAAQVSAYAVSLGRS